MGCSGAAAGYHRPGNAVQNRCRAEVPVVTPPSLRSEAQRIKAHRRRTVAWVAVAVHIVACLALLLVQGGTEAVPEMAERHRWVAAHVPLWIGAWLLWMLASLSLVAFTLVWTARLRELGTPRGWTVVGCIVVASGLVF